MRSRITITISQDLLDKIESMIDGHTARNRSQVIEKILRHNIAPTIDTAIILAGGSLCKFKPFTDTPTALLPIDNKPLILHTLNHLINHGFSQVIICLNHKNLLIKHFLDQQNLNLSISYSLETNTLGTGGALKHIAAKLPSKPFLLLHSDILTNINLSQFIEFFLHQGQLASVAIKPRPGRLSYGRIFIQGNRVTSFHQPTKTTPISLINTGIYLFNHTCLPFLPKQKHFRLETTLIPNLIKQSQLNAFTFQGVWYDVSSSTDYQEANHRWTSLK